MQIYKFTKYHTKWKETTIHLVINQMFEQKSHRKININIYKLGENKVVYEQSKS